MVTTHALRWKSVAPERSNCGPQMRLVLQQFLMHPVPVTTSFRVIFGAGVAEETCVGGCTITKVGDGEVFRAGFGVVVVGGVAAAGDEVGGALTETGRGVEKMGAVAHLRDSSFRRLIISKRVDSI
ncbi:hypothetical protein HanIR_Chr06g0256271 [Helianthus annuus]|nr:hypothetical protein HanIR_Chr06g0256271 [Helianthus annuus]